MNKAFCTPPSRPHVVSAAVLRILLCAVLTLFVTFNTTAGENKHPRRDRNWYSVYFTSPGKNAPAPTENPQTALVTVINGARRSFHGAFYKISSPEVAAALIKAHRRGIDVGIVTESDNLGTPQIHELRNSGIRIVADRRKGLMHHKFAVIDGESVWTGSYNLTPKGAFRNNNNSIHIRSSALSAVYTVEFMEMFRQGVFGNRRETGVLPLLTNRHYVEIEGTPVNVYFSPEDRIERILIKRLRKARHSVYFMAYAFTSGPLADELIQLHKKGVSVGGIFEKSGTAARQTQYVKLKLEGVPVYLDRNPDSMHHKVIIIDEETVITGSYNFSRGADRKNDENILIILNREIARLYLEEYKRLLGKR